MHDSIVPAWLCKVDIDVAVRDLFDERFEIKS